MSLPGLREALRAAGYTVDGVTDLLGQPAHRALSRNETGPGLRATGGGSPLETLTRLWPLQATVSEDHAQRALPGLVGSLCAAGVLDRSGDQVTARVDVRPYAEEDRDWWVVSDLAPGLDGTHEPVSPDHVLGVSSASTSLAQLTVREPVGRALDLGTGCGVQALHLGRHSAQVVATDVNRRALRMAEMTAALNDVDVEVRRGSLFEPVAEEKFDLVVSNPPFVVSPATGRLLAYRDSGLPGDEVVRRLVQRAPRHLRAGGWCQLLANWVHLSAQPWQDRVTGWLVGSGCDAWVVQREVLDPAEYVELWLRDAGLHGSPRYADRYHTWLSWFEEQQVSGVGFGWVSLRRHQDGGHRDPVVRVEDWPYEIEQPLWAEVAGWSRRVDFDSSVGNTELLASRLVVRSDVRQETVGAPGAEDPELIVLRQSHGMRRAREVDTVTAGLVGACDGDLRVGQVLDALARLLDREAGELRGGYLAVVRDLVADGFLEPA